MATQQQTNTFLQAIGKLPGEKSLANSAAVLAYPHTHMDWIRPGVALFGACPLRTPSPIPLQPVMTLKSKLIQIKQVPPNAPVGYGGAWHAGRDGALIGIIGLGYGSGYPRDVPSGTPVLLHGTKVPIVGRVSMDKITLDLQAVPFAKIGDPVTLFGEGLGAEILARLAKTIPHDILTHMGIRHIPRHIIQEPAP